PTLYTLSLHDALPIYALVKSVKREENADQHHVRRHREADVDGKEDEKRDQQHGLSAQLIREVARGMGSEGRDKIEKRVDEDCLRDRKSTRLNSSHSQI